MIGKIVCFSVSPDKTIGILVYRYDKMYDVYIKLYKHTGFRSYTCNTKEFDII